MESTGSRNRIGARRLTSQEVKLILPTYEQITKQIEQFREEKRESRQTENQKTNNIGIIGARGAGKTSVLKTIRAELEEKQKKREQTGADQDIILPIIVPENMSESSTLMATILGMLKAPVRERAKQMKENRTNGKYDDCIGESKLEKDYNEVVKQYTFIQKEYRDILIHEYTTENDYVKSSTKVFNSDVEFITKFNQLLDALLNGEEQPQNALLFLFIDDIDLSTHRCADVVRTLLSYLSNQNIVTLLSGDLSTFEEALTLDFLRQENVLDKNMIDQSMMISGSGLDLETRTLLASKKQLAYEYLKKILPPVYRHNIKEWSLDEKGNYCILDSNEENPEEKTLSHLLATALRGWIDPAFFRYIRLEHDDKNRQTEEQEVIPYTYHLFDNTSRGLNNIYNLLREIEKKRENESKDFWKEDEKGRFLEEKKQLLDTIISSKQLYNQYRDKIQGVMFRINEFEKEGKVFFDNAYAIIYREEKQELKEDTKGKTAKQDIIVYNIKNPVDRFSLFLFVDFAARIFYERKYQKIVDANEDYQALKKKAMEDLFFNPVIAEKAMGSLEDYDWRLYKTSSNMNREIRLKMTMYDVNAGFLLAGDLVFNLTYYKNLPLERILTLYQKQEDTRQDSHNIENRLFPMDLKQRLILSFWQTVSSLAKLHEKEVVEQIAQYYPVFSKEFTYIENQISGIPIQNIVNRLFDEDCKKAVPDTPYADHQLVWRILLNTIAEQQPKAKQGKEKEEGPWKKLPAGENTEILSKKGREGCDEKRKKILEGIGKNNLWSEEVVKENVEDYLRHQLCEYFKRIFSGLAINVNTNSPEWIVNISNAQKKWNEFDRSPDGTTYTNKAKETKRNLFEIIAGETERNKNRISYKTYEKIIDELRKLAWNYRVWYGRAEAQDLLKCLQEAYAEPVKKESDDAGGDHAWEKYKEYYDFIFYLSYYYDCKMANDSADQINQEAEILKKITESLSIAHRKADRQVLDTLIDKLNEVLDPEDRIDSDEFEELFSKNQK